MARGSPVTAEVALRRLGKLLDMDLTEVKVAAEQKLNRKLTPEETITLFENEIKKWREKKVREV